MNSIECSGFTDPTLVSPPRPTEEEHFFLPTRPTSPAYRPKLGSHGNPTNPLGLTLKIPLGMAAVDEMVWKAQEHITALISAALTIDLVQRPKRPVLDRRKSTLVEVDSMGKRQSHGSSSSCCCCCCCNDGIASASP